jgi:hypothetical protein
VKSVRRRGRREGGILNVLGGASEMNGCRNHWMHEPLASFCIAALRVQTTGINTSARPTYSLGPKSYTREPFASILHDGVFKAVENPE